MTNLTKNVRRTVTTKSGRELIVTFSPEGIYTREKGRRKQMGPVPWGWVDTQAAKLVADAALADKKRRPRASRGLLGRGI